MGLKQSLKALQNGEAKTVIIAKDADESIIEEVKLICDNNNIEVIYVDEMKKIRKSMQYRCWCICCVYLK